MHALFSPPRLCTHTVLHCIHSRLLCLCECSPANPPGISQREIWSTAQTLHKALSAWSICAYIKSGWTAKKRKKWEQRTKMYFPRLQQANINRVSNAPWLPMFSTCYLRRLWDRLLIWEGQPWLIVTNIHDMQMLMFIMLHESGIILMWYSGCKYNGLGLDCIPYICRPVQLIMSLTCRSTYAHDLSHFCWP